MAIYFYIFIANKIYNQLLINILYKILNNKNSSKQISWFIQAYFGVKLMYLVVRIDF